MLFFRILDISFQIDAPFEIEVTKELKEFEVKQVGKVDESITFEQVTKLPEVPESIHMQGLRLYVKVNEEEITCFLPSPGKEPYAMTVYEKDDQVKVFYLSNTKEFTTKSYGILNLLGLEKILLKHAGIILHASFVRWQGQGIAFSAPSGTGKSTQASLWERYMGAEILNGDRVGIRNVDGVWKGYGMPYAGSSNIYRNDSVPIKSIVILRQAADNRIRKLNTMESVRMLFPEISIHRWDEEFVNKVFDILTRLLERITVYLLECRADYGAVELLAKTIVNEEMK